ncbi:MAG: FHA domain-containing protein [Gemmataceae bacterium]|nr:FHA domain-containing protein [Gemmataceae bacterium]MCI0741994.1 FHA domain-containing protein [Gemmataceae bacterium]
MALLSRIYFNAVFGALGGLLGWMLFGIFGEKNPSSETAFLFFTHEGLNWLLGGAVIGGAIGYFVVSVEAIRDQSLVRFARLASYGVLLGAVGGALGMYLGEQVNYLFVRLSAGAELQRPSLLLTMLGRGLGWSILGVAIGMSEGIAARSLGRFSYGTLGGLLGGFVGGMLFELFYSFGGTSYFWSALGLVILGACIGSLSALVQAVFQPACLRVLRGWQEGREYPLEKPASLLGREEHADIALFRDMKIEKRHAYVKRINDRYVLVNNNAPAEYTLVNDRPVPQAVELQDGDRIQLGNVVLRFQLRAAANRQRRKPAPQPGVLVPPKPR